MSADTNILIPVKPVLTGELQKGTGQGRGWREQGSDLINLQSGLFLEDKNVG